MILLGTHLCWIAQVRLGFAQLLVARARWVRFRRLFNLSLQFAREADASLSESVERIPVRHLLPVVVARRSGGLVVDLSLTSSASVVGQRFLDEHRVRAFVLVSQVENSRGKEKFEHTLDLRLDLEDLLVCLCLVCERFLCLLALLLEQLIQAR